MWLFIKMVLAGGELPTNMSPSGSYCADDIAVAIFLYLFLRLFALVPLLSLASNIFSHVNVVITPECYTYQRALELTPKSEAVAIHPTAAGPESFAMGYVCRHRLVLKTASLQEAKVSLIRRAFIVQSNC